MSKTATFETRDFNTYKIYKYIPSCPKNNIYNKNIYLQLLGEAQNGHFYIHLYDNFDKIAQDKNGKFINAIKEDIKIIVNEYSTLISNLNCSKEYYVVISNTYSVPNTFVSGFIFNIIDADIDIINLTPKLSDFFSFHKRKKDKEEIITYFNNETKYGLFTFCEYATIKILKNNELFYQNKRYETKKELLLEKNSNYTIHFNSPNRNFFTLQLFNEPFDFKYDFKNGPIALYYSNYHYLEIDISEYKLNDIILFSFFSYFKYSFRYQYKKNLIGNNFIQLGCYNYNNFIPIKKTIEDSTLVVRIEMYQMDYSIMSIIHDQIEEIKSEYKKIIIGPKYFLIDYVELNNMNSIGIGANESFNLFEEYKDYLTYTSFIGYQNNYITKFDNNNPNIFKSALIYFNSTSNILFEVKKFNYSIFSKNEESDTPMFDYEFFQLCQGQNALNELYFYVFISEYKELFSSVFGTFDSYFIKEKEIKNLSDFDFDKIKEPNFFNFIKDEEQGFLKIKCKKPLMLKHTFLPIPLDRNNLLDSGNKYYLEVSSGMSLKFNNNLINKNINLKITLFGLHSNQQIQFMNNNNAYNLNDKPFYLNFIYENNSSNSFYFKEEEISDNSIIAEIIVSFLQENINKNFKQKDFKDSLGTLDLKKEEGIIIKIPHNFNEDLYDSSLIIHKVEYPNSISYNYIYSDIVYDKLEFLSIIYERFEKAPASIPLFNLNPYDEIENNLLDENKFFYILIYSKYESQIYIRKPKLFSDFKLNTINFFSELNKSNLIYYYKIKLPIQEKNNNSLSIQIDKQKDYSQNAIFSKSNIQYHLIYENYELSYSKYFNLPYDKNSNFTFINYYLDDINGFINFIDSNEKIDNDLLYKIIEKSIKNVEQIEGKNKLEIKFESFSYLFYPNAVKYYLIFNIEKDSINIYSILAGQKKLNQEEHQFMVIIEDDGLNERFTKEIDINISLFEGEKKSNNITIIPVMNKTNLVLDDFVIYEDFIYKNASKNKGENKNKTLLIILIPIAVIIIIVIAVLFLRYRRKKNNKDLAVNKVLQEELDPIDS